MFVIICSVISVAIFVAVIALIVWGLFLRTSGKSQCEVLPSEVLPSEVLPGIDLSGEIGSYISFPSRKTFKASSLAKECEEEAVRKWEKNEAIPGHEEISLGQMKREVRRWVRRETWVIEKAMHMDLDPPEDEVMGEDDFPVGGML